MAECVTADDLTSGLRIVDAEGTAITHRPGDGDIIEVTYDYGGGAGTVETRLFGVHALVIQELSDGEPIEAVRFEIAYDDGPDALPHPRDITEFRTGIGSLYLDERTDLQLVYLGADIEQTHLGACAYATRFLRIEQHGDQGLGQWEEFLYFSDLGTAHLTASGFGPTRFESGPVSLERISE